MPANFSGISQITSVRPFYPAPFIVEMHQCINRYFDIPDLPFSLDTMDLPLYTMNKDNYVKYKRLRESGSKL